MLVNPEALRAVVDFLNQHRIAHMVIGGLANAVWGEVRLTRDADFKISTDLPPSDFRRLVLGHFPERQTGLPQHLRSSLVIHISTFAMISGQESQEPEFRKHNMASPHQGTRPTSSTLASDTASPLISRVPALPSWVIERDSVKKPLAFG